jgi:hypothetical protein
MQWTETKLTTASVPGFVPVISTFAPQESRSAAPDICIAADSVPSNAESDHPIQKDAVNDIALTRSGFRWAACDGSTLLRLISYIGPCDSSPNARWLRG